MLKWSIESPRCFKDSLKTSHLVVAPLRVLMIWPDFVFEDAALRLFDAGTVVFSTGSSHIRRFRTNLFIQKQRFSGHPQGRQREQRVSRPVFFVPCLGVESLMIA